jgi:hypothetical protein
MQFMLNSVTQLQSTIPTLDDADFILDTPSQTVEISKETGLAHITFMPDPNDVQSEVWLDVSEDGFLLELAIDQLDRLVEAVLRAKAEGRWPDDAKAAV